MKYLGFISLLLVLLFASALGASAEMPIDIEVNGEKITADSEPFISSGSVYAPIRFISEALLLDCSWDEESRTAVIEDENLTVRFLPDSSLAYVGRKKTVIPSKIVDGRIMIPVRFLSQTMGATVDWDEKYYRVLITKEGVDVPPSLCDDTYDQDEVYWLAQIINAESMGEPMDGQIAVGNVVLNRVAVSGFPNTIYGVIFDRVGGVQFEPVLNQSIYLPASQSSIEAAKRALSGENKVGDCLFFLNPLKAQSSWIINSRTYYTSIGGHDFYI